MRVAVGALHKAAREIIRKTRALANMRLEQEAQCLAKRVPDSKILIDEEKAYARFSSSQIGISDEVTKVSTLAAAWIQDPARNTSDKPFLRKILASDDLFVYPEIINIALHDQLFGVVTSYLGQVPWMTNLQIWWTPPNQTAERSQIYHYDHRDTRQAKVFINLNDVDEDSGPLHFLPATSSSKVDRSIGYSQGDFTDDQVASCCSKDEVVKALGPTGSGYIVDTARCLHYGSRGNRKDRLVMMVSFARVNCVDKGHGCDVLDPVRKKLAETYFRDDAAKSFALTMR